MSTTSLVKDRIVAWTTLITAIAISGVAAYFSVDGIIALFSTTPWKAGIMATVLEIGKIVTALWLHHNWGYGKSYLLKAYLVISVVILMGITSMGIFGTLSKSFQDHFLVSQEASFDAAYIDNQIESLNEARDTVSDEMNRLDQLSRFSDAYLERGGALNIRRGLAAAKEQQAAREELRKQRLDIEAQIAELQKQKLEQTKQFTVIEAEVGPVVYIAEIIYAEKTPEIIKKSVIFVIGLIVICFDPMAILLLIASQISFNRIREYKDPEPVYIEVPVDYNGVTEPEIETPQPPENQTTSPNNLDNQSTVSDISVQKQELLTAHSSRIQAYLRKLEQKADSIKNRQKRG